MKDMKKLFLAIQVLLFAALSCTKEIGPEAPPKPLDDHVTLTFGVNRPPVTKGVLGEVPDIQDIHVAVFVTPKDGTSAYLKEYNLATINEDSFEHTETIGGEQVTHTDYSYSVSLPLSEEKCILHFIANGPATIPFGNEATVMSSLITSKGSSKEDGYWQMRVLENGIPYDKDVFNEQGIVQLPANFASENDLTHIPMVRNFAKLTVRVDEELCDNFTLSGFVLINEPMAGSIAPYNHENYSFLSDFETYDYAGLKAQYPGYMPASVALDESIPTTETFASQSFASGAFAYIYERPSYSKTDKPLHILMKGTYTDENDVVHDNRYYRINILDSSSVATFFRNMQYDIVITGVEQIGSDTPEGAEANLSSIDISSDIIQELLSYQDGDFSIFVEYTSVTYVSAGTYTVKFRYVEDGVNKNNMVTIDKGTGSVVTSATITSLDDGTNVDGLGGWGTVTYVVSAPGPLKQDQIMTITGGTLSRGVKVSLMGPQNMTLELVPPSILKNVGEETTLIIGIPKGLPSSIFPLNLKIESDKLSVSPQVDDYLPVVTGPSIISSYGGRRTFQYVKTIDRATYAALVLAAEEEGLDKVYLEAGLKSNIALSACNIYVANPYFNTNSVYLDNYDPGHFTNLSYEGSNVKNYKVAEGEEKKVIFRFTMDKNATEDVYLTLTNLMLDPDYPDDLSNLVITGGKSRYELNSTTAGVHSVHLITTSETSDVNAELSSHQFINASLAASRKAIGLDFNGYGFVISGRENVGENQVGYYFNYNTGAIGTNVIVSVSGGIIDTAADARFSQTSDGPDGSKRYIFTTGNSQQNQTFNITSSYGQSISVELAASGYTTTEKDTKLREIRIPANTLSHRRNGISKMRNSDIYVYIDQSSIVYSGGSFQNYVLNYTTNNQSFNQSQLVIPISDSDGITNTSSLYFAFRYWNNIYTASGTVSDLISNSTTQLNFY
jgi:hypothetical protein